MRVAVIELRYPLAPAEVMFGTSAWWRPLSIEQADRKSERGDKRAHRPTDE